MIKHLKFTGIPVSDQSRALEFYVDKLGFEKLKDAPYGEDRWIEVAPPGAETYFLLSHAKYMDEPKVERKTPDYVLVVDDVQKTYQTLSGRGVGFIQTPIEQSWGPGTYAIFVDPDGNKFLIGD